MMRFTLVTHDRIAAEWPAIAERLWPAVRQDPTYTLEVLRNRLENGLDWLFEAEGGGTCLIVIELGNDLSCWIKALAGTVEGGPKARLRTIREGVDFIESVARTAGCASVRICGRDWSAILPNYEPFDGYRNGLEKRL